MADVFEAHMTFDLGDAETIRDIGDTEGWKFSQIKGDPILGPGTKCYLTSHGEDADKLLETMRYISATLSKINVPTLRTKIEHIIYDSSTGIDRIKRKTSSW